MSSRHSHRILLIGDGDVLHTGIVAAAACVLSAGRGCLGYVVRVWRVARRARGRPERGGGADGEPSEAEIARNALVARGVGDVPLQLEAQSRDTLQNLRNARDLLRGAALRAVQGNAAAAALPRVTLLSNRYHLARCALFARQLGFEHELCAAEPRLPLGPRTLLRLAGEAAYVCWTDVGTRWARLIGHRRMLARVT